MKASIILIFLFSVVLHSWSQDGVTIQVEEPAMFPGGTVELRKFLKTNLQYPQRALELALEGKCYLQFVVRKNGSIDSLVVKRGIIDCPECDQEALRLIRIMPPWIPGKVNGIAVDSYFNLPLIFKLQ